MDENYIRYTVVFLLVFVPYLFVSFFVNKPKIKISEAERNSLPGVFKLLWPLLAFFAESLGSFCANLQPSRKSKIEQALKRADIRMSAEQVFAAEVILGLLGFIAGAMFFLALANRGGVAFVIMMISGSVGLMWASNTVYKAAEDRTTSILRSLPFAIDLVSSSMRAGTDFTAAIRYYVSTDKSTLPLVVEFRTMLSQLELGKTRTDALEAMAERISNDVFSSFVDAVVHGIEVGASIVDTMRIQAEEMRRVRFNIAERKAARAASAMIFPIAVFIMPAMFIIMGTPIILRVMSSGLGGLMK